MASNTVMLSPPFVGGRAVPLLLVYTIPYVPHYVKGFPKIFFCPVHYCSSGRDFLYVALRGAFCQVVIAIYHIIRVLSIHFKIIAYQNTVQMTRMQFVHIVSYDYDLLIHTGGGHHHRHHVDSMDSGCKSHRRGIFGGVRWAG